MAVEVLLGDAVTFKGRLMLAAANMDDLQVLRKSPAMDAAKEKSPSRKEP